MTSLMIGAGASPIATPEPTNEPTEDEIRQTRINALVEKVRCGDAVIVHPSDILSVMRECIHNRQCRDAESFTMPFDGYYLVQRKPSRMVRIIRSDNLSADDKFALLLRHGYAFECEDSETTEEFWKVEIAGLVGFGTSPPRAIGQWLNDWDPTCYPMPKLMEMCDQQERIKSAGVAASEPGR